MTASSAALLAQAEAARRAGRVAEGIALAEQSLAAADGDAIAAALARLELANLLRYVPETLRAVQLLGEAERAFRPQGHPALARTLTIKGMALGDAGDYAGALGLHREALAILEAPGRERDLFQEASTLGAVGLACTQLGDFAQAEDAYRQANALY